MYLSHVQKLLVAADPFTAIRKNYRAWKKQPGFLRGRHLTVAQREHISTDLKDVATGPISMTAAPSDREAVGYLGEIANVLEDTGFKVEMNNTKRESLEQEIPPGVEMTVKDETVRPVHAYRIVAAFRRAGVAIAARISMSRQKNDTLYISVGPNGEPTPVPPTIQTAATWQAKVLAAVRAKWKKKFATGL